LVKWRRPTKRSALIIFLVVGLLLSASGTRVANNSWPGLSVDGDVAYVAFGPQILAVDIVEEELQWSFPNQPNQSLLFYAAPSVLEGKIVVGDYGQPGGFFSPKVTVGLYALDGEGKQIWEQKAIATDRIVAPPLQVDGRIFVGTSDNFVIALDADDGTELWRYETGHSVWAQPVYQDGVVYVASLDRNLYALDSENGQELWQASVDGSISDEPALGSGLVFVGGFDKHVHALETGSGEKKWTYESPAAVWASPVVSEDVVYFADLEGNIGALEAASGKTIWLSSISETIIAAPTVMGDIVYFATAGSPDIEDDLRNGSIYALDILSGDTLWSEEVDGLLFTSPVIVNDLLVVAIHEGQNILEVFNSRDGDHVWDYRLPEQ